MQLPPPVTSDLVWRENSVTMGRPTRLNCPVYGPRRAQTLSQQARPSPRISGDVMAEGPVQVTWPSRSTNHRRAAEARAKRPRRGGDRSSVGRARAAGREPHPVQSGPLGRACGSRRKSSSSAIRVACRTGPPATARPRGRQEDLRSKRPSARGPAASGAASLNCRAKNMPPRWSMTAARGWKRNWPNLTRNGTTGAERLHTQAQRRRIARIPAAAGNPRQASPTAPGRIGDAVSGQAGELQRHWKASRQLEEQAAQFPRPAPDRTERRVGIGPVNPGRTERC